MPDTDDQESEQIIPRRRGRPPGTVLSRETRFRISEARLAQERRKRAEREGAPLPAAFPGLSDAVRRAVSTRDERRCAACDEDGPDLAIHTFVEGASSPLDFEHRPELHAVLCQFCRTFAEDIGARSMSALNRSNW